MGSGLGAFAFIVLAFVGWLMWSGKGAKESFATFAWISMAFICAIQIFAYLF